MIELITIWRDYDKKNSVFIHIIYYNFTIIIQDGAYDTTGELPLDFAINKGYTDIADYLKSHNAKKYKELK